MAVEAHLPHYPATVGEVEEELQAEDIAERRWLTEAVAYAADHGVDLAVRTVVGHPAQASCDPTGYTGKGVLRAVGNLIALTTAMGESTLRVLDYGDLAGPDSGGLFQQPDEPGRQRRRVLPRPAPRSRVVGDDGHGGRA